MPRSLHSLVKKLTDFGMRHDGSFQEATDQQLYGALWVAVDDLPYNLPRNFGTGSCCPSAQAGIDTSFVLPIRAIPRPGRCLCEISELPPLLLKMRTVWKETLLSSSIEAIQRQGKEAAHVCSATWRRSFRFQASRARQARRQPWETPQVTFTVRICLHSISFAEAILSTLSFQVRPFSSPFVLTSFFLEFVHSLSGNQSDGLQVKTSSSYIIMSLGPPLSSSLSSSSSSTAPRRVQNAQRLPHPLTPGAHLAYAPRQQRTMPSPTSLAVASKQSRRLRYIYPSEAASA